MDEYAGKKKFKETVCWKISLDIFKPDAGDCLEENKRSGESGGSRNYYISHHALTSVRISVAQHLASY